MTVAQITTVIPPLGPAPNPDEAETFDDLATQFVSDQVDVRNAQEAFRVEANALATDVNAKALAAENSAANAAQAAVDAGATTWTAGTYALNTAKVSALDNLTYRKRTATSATTIDPRDDPTNWKNISNVGPVAGTLTDSGASGTPIEWDAGAIQIPTVNLVGNRTLAAPTNLKVGTYVMHLVQDATGNRTFTFDLTVCKFPGNLQPSIGLAPNERTIISGISDGTKLYCSYQPGF